MALGRLASIAWASRRERTILSAIGPRYRRNLDCHCIYAETFRNPTFVSILSGPRRKTTTGLITESKIALRKRPSSRSQRPLELAGCKRNERKSESEQTTVGQPSIASLNKKGFGKRSKPSPSNAYSRGSASRSAVRRP